MTFASEKFAKEVPPTLREILKVVWDLGFIPTAMGGVVRDFLLKGKTGNDWDIELVHPTMAFNRQHWKDLGSALQKFGKINYLPFEIIRLEVKSFHFEFSPPRKEIFMPDWKSRGHKNFTAEFDYRLAPEIAAARRDFTINALGVKMEKNGSFLLVDPLHGIKDLELKLLRACGDDFEKDSVRFLRAYRLKSKLGFGFSEALSKTLMTMPLESFSAHYVWEEMKKSGKPLEFYRELILSPRDLYLPAGKELLPKWAELKKILLNPSEHEQWVLALEFLNISSEPWQKFFNVGSDSMRKLARWAKSSRTFMNYKPEMFQGEFEEIKDKMEFDLLFDWYFTTKQLLSKYNDLPLMKLIEEELPEWIHLYRFEALKDLKHIEPPLRARYQLWNICQRL